MPQIGDEISVYYTIGANTQLIFGGTLVTMEPIVSGGVVLLYQMTAADWGYQFDAKVVKKNYAGIDPHDIVVDLVSTFCPGFTTNHVQTGNFLVSTIQFNYQQPSKCLEALAKQIGWDWYIDPTKDVHFYFAEGNIASSSEITQAPFAIDDTSGNIEWPTLDVQIDITNMKNAVYVVGGSYAKYFVLDPNPNATPPEYAPVDVYTSVAGTFVYPLAYPYDETTLTVTLTRRPIRARCRCSTTTRAASCASPVIPAAATRSWCRARRRYPFSPSYPTPHPSPSMESSRTPSLIRPS
jgi:hypothetical protein